MKTMFVNNSMEYLIRNNACSKEQINVFRYTLESLYSFITKSATVLIISLFSHTFYFTLISLILFSILRGFAFGIHASSNLHCWITTISIYGLCPILIQNYSFSNIFIITCYVIGILATLLWAPADTPKRPLLNKKKRIANKIISLGIILSYIILSLILNNFLFYKIICFILLLHTICICPLTYKLFHIPYHNYKYYKKNMV